MEIFQTVRPNSGRGRLREVVSYEWFQLQWLHWENVGISKSGRLREVVAYGGSTELTTSTFPWYTFFAPPPPKFCKTYCFQFLLETCTFPREIENNSLWKTWGANKACYGNVEVVSILANSKPDVNKDFRRRGYSIKIVRGDLGPKFKS